MPQPSFIQNNGSRSHASIPLLRWETNTRQNYLLLTNLIWFYSINDLTCKLTCKQHPSMFPPIKPDVNSRQDSTMQRYQKTSEKAKILNQKSRKITVVKSTNVEPQGIMYSTTDSRGKILQILCHISSCKPSFDELIPSEHQTPHAGPVRANSMTLQHVNP